MTPKQLFLEMLKPDGKPERQLVQYEALSFIMPDPILMYLMDGRRPGTTSPRSRSLLYKQKEYSKFDKNNKNPKIKF